MFGRVNVWRIAKLKVACYKLGKWIDFGYKDTNYKINFTGLSLVIEPQTIPLIH